MPSEADLQQVAMLLKQKLARYGLTPSNGPIDDDSETDGWWIEISTWRKGRPAVGIYLDRYLGNQAGTERHFWFGFWSASSQQITILQRLADSSESLRVTSADIDVSGRLNSRKTGQVLDQEKPIYETYVGDYTYLGFYDVNFESEQLTPESLATQAALWIGRVVSDVDGPTEEADVRELEKRKDLTPTEREALIKARRGKGQFRKDLCKKWGGCAVTRCKVNEVLRASHIQPWKVSSDPDRVNPNNGLLLTATLDSLFDRTLISFSDSGDILISPILSSGDRQLLKLEQIKLSKKLNDKQKNFLKIHRASAGFSD